MHAVCLHVCVHVCVCVLMSPALFTPLGPGLFTPRLKCNMARHSIKFAWVTLPHTPLDSYQLSATRALKYLNQASTGCAILFIHMHFKGEHRVIVI